jgi:hypothetical protein
MSCEMGYFKGCGSNDADGNTSRENSRNVRMDVSEAPTMDLDDLDKIPVVSI